MVTPPDINGLTADEIVLAIRNTDPELADRLREEYDERLAICTNGGMDPAEAARVTLDGLRFAVEAAGRE